MNDPKDGSDRSGATDGPPQLAGLPQYSWQQQWIFIVKELRETLRDRRTIITLLAMPLLLYPLLGLGFRFLAFQQLTRESPEFQMALNSDQEAGWFSDLMLLGERSIEARLLLEASSGQAVPASAASPPPAEGGMSWDSVNSDAQVQIFTPNDGLQFDLEQLVAEGRADLGMRVTRIGELAGPANVPRARVELIVNENILRSLQAADFVVQRLQAAEKELLHRWSNQQNIEVLSPIESERRVVKSASGGSAALSLLPLILLLMTVTGGVYPAIDLTAGERERNTLETLISLPVPRIRLLAAKFVAVVTVTMLTGLMNLSAMFITLYSLQLDSALLGQGGITLALAGKLFLVLSAFALFYSAILLLLTSSARSFKEAQAYLIPLLLLSIGPGLVTLIPGWTLGHGTAVIPLINILLLSRDLLLGQASLLPSTVAVVSTILYGLAGLALAAKVFGADAVAVGSRSLWSDLLRRPTSGTSQPTTTLVLGGLAVLFPAYFIASGLLSRGDDLTPSYRLTLSGLLTVILFFGIPWLLLGWKRIPLRSGLALHLPRSKYLLYGLLLGLSTWPLIFEIVVYSQAIGFQSLDLSRFEEVEKLLEGWATIPLPLVLMAMAVAPGVCEEVFFRGFLFGGLRTALSDRTTVILTAIAFGLFHLILAGGAAPERLIPSTLMGLLLGYVRMSSGSLVPGIALHVVHNASLLSIAHYRDELAGWGLGGLQQSHLPTPWIIAAGIVTGASLILLSHGSSKTK